TRITTTCSGERVKRANLYTNSRRHHVRLLSGAQEHGEIEVARGAPDHGQRLRCFCAVLLGVRVDHGPQLPQLPQTLYAIPSAERVLRLGIQTLRHVASPQAFGLLP